MSLICGINPVLEALRARARHFDRLLIAKGTRNRRISVAMRRAGELGVALRFETREALDRLAQGLNHQGIIAVVSPVPLHRVEDLLAEARDPSLLVLLDGVEDPRNLGAILRTAETAGADGVLIPERRSAGLSDVVSRASAGAADHLRLARVGNVAQTLDLLKERGIWVVGFDAGAEARWDGIDYTSSVALVLGGEGKGIRRLTRERCDQLVSIPLFGHISSLNVSVAAGIALYEVIRQRGSVPSQLRPIPLASLAAEISQGSKEGDGPGDPMDRGPGTEPDTHHSRAAGKTPDVEMDHDQAQSEELRSRSGSTRRDGRRTARPEGGSSPSNPGASPSAEVGPPRRPSGRSRPRRNKAHRRPATKGLAEAQTTPGRSGESVAGSTGKRAKVSTSGRSTAERRRRRGRGRGRGRGR